MLRTVLLLPGQDGPFWRHRHRRELGVGCVISRDGRPLWRLAEVVHRGLGVHGGGLCSTIELDCRWGVGGHTGYRDEVLEPDGATEHVVGYKK